MDVLVVESPAKAKTIESISAPATPCWPPTAMSATCRPRTARSARTRISPWTGRSTPSPRSGIDAIAKAVTKGGKLYPRHRPGPRGRGDFLARARGAQARRRRCKGVDVKRVTFNAITKQSVLDAVAHPRELDQRADRRLPGAPRARLSRRLHPLAGAVAQAAGQPLGRPRAVGGAAPDLRARGRDRGLQDPRILDGRGRCSAPPRGRRFKARLTHLDGRKLDKFDLDTEAARRAGQARDRAPRLRASPSIDRRQVRRNPPPPFITSTLQQEASRKLGLRRRHRTMRIAQRLYEGVDIGGETVGLITYMRTDGVQLAPEAIGADAPPDRDQVTARATCRSSRASTQSKAKNAQEAHEAIRPTDLFRTPQDVAAPSRQGPARPLRADLEAHRGEPDGKRRARPGHGRHRQRPTRPCSCAPPARS